MDIFIGRFHPLAVHLPIGFLLLAFIFESLSFFFSTFKGNRKVVAVMYFLSFLVSIAAVSSGLMLSENGAYGISTLNSHKWLGISVAVFSLGIAFIKWKPTSINPKVSYGLSVVLIILVSLTGHYGGILTHGDDYLYENAPGWFQSLAGYEPHGDLSELSDKPPDSVMLYSDVVRPILDAKCVRCHNEDDAAGGFNAASYATLFEEGETKKAVVAGSVSGSELFRRISLPTSSVKYMPPNGHPLSYTELNILRYWIQEGADSSARFNYATMNKELAELVKRDYDLDFTPRPYYEKVAVDSLPPEVFETLSRSGFLASYLGGDNYFLDIKYTGDTLDKDGLTPLQQVGNNVTFLDLSGIFIVDSTLMGLEGFKNLTRLDLHGSNVSDNSFANFQSLEHLEVLNLFQTPVGDAGLENALASPGLKRVYLWQTRVSDDVINRVESEYPDIEFDRGFTLVAPDTTAASTGTP